MDLPKMTELEQVQNNLNAQLIRIAYLENEINKLKIFEDFYKNLKQNLSIVDAKFTCQTKEKL